MYLQGYDISFLITNFHTEQMYKHKLVDFVVQVCMYVRVCVCVCVHEFIVYCVCVCVCVRIPVYLTTISRL